MEATLEQATQALRTNAIPALRRVQVRETPQSVVISGKVQSYYYKQLAQETVLPYLSGREFANQISVVRQTSPR
jgi:hypothetical protein